MLTTRGHLKLGRPPRPTFETLKRQGYRALICVMKDGGYSSEFHKLRADGIDDHLAVFARPRLENIARGFACATTRSATCR